MRLKVLVLGSTGLIGHQVFNYLVKSKNYELYNISYRKKLNDDTILCDVRNQYEFIKVVKSISPDVPVATILPATFNCEPGITTFSVEVPNII